MEVIFLGTGTGVPSVRRASPALAVIFPSLTLLVDSGSGTMRQMVRAGLSYTGLDAILYTHFHPDHTAELVPFLFTVRYWPGFQRPGPIRIVGPEGLKSFYTQLGVAYGHWIEPAEGRVTFEERPLGKTTAFRLGTVEAQSGPVPHTDHSLGYRLIEPGGPVLAVTGDTDYGPGLIELARGADLLVTECSSPEGSKIDGHLTPVLAGRVAREAGVRALALTHFYPDTEGHDLKSQAASEFDGPITLAEDFTRIVLPGRES